MNLADVMDEVAARIDTIEGLRTYSFPADLVQPPAAVVTYPETYNFDDTYARGMDRLTLPVVVLVGKVSDRATKEHIGAYANGAGERSLKEFLEAEPTPSRLFIPDSEGSNASTPRTEVLDLTDGVIVELDIELAAATFTGNLVTATVWANTSTAHQGWICYLLGNGRLSMAWSDTDSGQVRFPSESVGGVQAGRRTYKFDLNAATGVTEFFRAPTWGGSYTSLGTSSDPAGTLRVPDSSVPLALGNNGADAVGQQDMYIHHARVTTRSGVIGAEIDLTKLVAGITEFEDNTTPSPRTWTLDGDAAIDGGSIPHYTSFDSVRVQSVEFDTVQIGGIDLLAATFMLDIVGQGA